ncbi:MAG: hypothetical protein PV344_07555 [Anaplasma sp.]|nr:hypothetical protein [Anaplasma sp.]
MLTYCPNCLRDLFFANRRRFAKFAKISLCENLVVYSTLFSSGQKKPFPVTCHGRE